MRRLLTVLSLAVTLGAWGCAREAGTEGPDALPRPGRTLARQLLRGRAVGRRLRRRAAHPHQDAQGEFKVWTKRFGNNPRIKLLLLHGGPGGDPRGLRSPSRASCPPKASSSSTTTSWAAPTRTSPRTRTSGPRSASSRRSSRCAWPWASTRDNFYLLGHSWGGILAAEYALKYGANLKGLVISNMMMSIPDYNRYADEVLAKQMDPAVVKEIQDLEAKGKYEDPRYFELLLPNFYAKHLCRLPEWPDAINRMFGHLNKDIYVLMQGPSEFGASGRLEKWDRKADLRSSPCRPWSSAAPTTPWTPPT